MFEDGVVIEYSIARNEAVVESLTNRGGDDRLFSVPLDELVAAISSISKRSNTTSSNSNNNSSNNKKNNIGSSVVNSNRKREERQRKVGESAAGKARCSSQLTSEHRPMKPMKSLPVKAIGRCLTFISGGDNEEEMEEMDVNDRPIAELLKILEEEITATTATTTEAQETRSSDPARECGSCSEESATKKKRKVKTKKEAPSDRKDVALEKVKTNWRYPLAKIVTMHDSFEMASKSMFTGTLRDVRGRFAIISSPFLQFDAMASLDVVWMASTTSTAGGLFPVFNHERSESNEVAEGEQITLEDLLRRDASALKRLLHRPVTFSLRMGTFMAHEAFVLVEVDVLRDAHRRCNVTHSVSSSSSVAACATEREAKNDAVKMEFGTSEANHDAVSSSEQTPGGQSEAQPSIAVTVPSNEAAPQSLDLIKVEKEVRVRVERGADDASPMDFPIPTESSKQFPSVPPAALHRSIGSWSVTGAPAEEFFQPRLTVHLTHDNVTLKNNTPPLMGAADGFSIQLLCLCMPDDCELSLRATSHNGSSSDVTTHVLDVRRRTSDDMSDQRTLMDHLATHPVAVFDATWKSACVPEEYGYLEVRLRLHAKLGEKEMHLTSKPILLRSAMYKEQYRQHLELDVTSIAHKYWISDTLGPEDSLLDGFLDPGRSNLLFRGRAAYAALPAVEREVIVIDERDERLHAIALSAQTTLKGIFDTQSKVQSLMWLVTSYYGGEMLGDGADLDTPLLRPTKKTRKRRRGEEVNSKVVRLGDVQHGLCRHRALLFKYLCDCLHIPCYLVRGEHQGPEDEEAERHSWNIVPVPGSESILVDTTLSPNALSVWPDPAYNGPSIDIGKEWDDGCSIAIRASSAQLHLLEECGCGAFSVVRRATYGGFTCAVKLPRKPSHKANLLYEYQILQSLLDVPCVVQCFGWSKGIIMEFFPTSMLGLMNTLIVRQQRLSYVQQKNILRGVLTALSGIHARRLVHRDIKSENVLAVIIRCSMCRSMGLVCQVCDVRVKVVDFADCVRVSSADSVVRSSHRVGTPPYAAPEIERELPFSYAADMWSVGVLALEMATMRLPTQEQLIVKGDATEPQQPPTSSSSEQQQQQGKEPKHGGPIPFLRGVKKPPQWLQALLKHTLVEDWTKRKNAAELLELLKS